jgi:hypothetical protein
MEVRGCYWVWIETERIEPSQGVVELFDVMIE